ncbi:porin family protein [Flavobacterium pallidum]|uniref:PorT family protein n=1 Tax=Flavobacterium pallidum TaxID=2172098 RepID=A0A2S1SJV4_9FLAO|nr:porin family protein [Flavobacterium pallidum]AWI26642.1 PorT family protein [Flavobacterium pallidum]
MKKKTALLFLFANLALFKVAAQQTTTTVDDNRESVRFGVKAGINLSNVYDEQNNDFVADNKVGFAAGAFVAIPIGKVIGFQPEVMYSEKGFKVSGSFLGNDYEYKRTNTYIDIPLQLQFKASPVFSILAGPQFSYLIQTKNNFNDGDFTNEQEEDINGQNYKKNIFGFTVGADFTISNLVISARGAWDISKTDSDGDSSDVNYKNQVLQLTVGYMF